MKGSSVSQNRNAQRRLVEKAPYRRLVPRLQNVIRLCALFVLMSLLTACDSTTVLLANFTSDTVGSPPGATQATGTVALDSGAGTITVVDAPAASLPANKWVQISHPTAPSPQTGMRGIFSRVGGVGDYGFLAALLIPQDTGVVTVQFEPIPEPNEYFGFLHLDFMPEGDVRIDDGPVRFGQFPRDQSFVLSVHLVITETTATAEISLLGRAASGSTTVNVNPSLLRAARQFGAVRFWMGFQHQGSFFVDEIIVTRRNQ